MCKFNQNLFITIFCLALIKTFNAYPIDYSVLDELIDEPSTGDNFDLTYDQRQNGTENIRLRVDGVVVALPSSSSNQASNSFGNLAANYLLQLAAQTDDDDDGDYLPFLKNSNTENGVTAPSTTGDKDDKNNIKKKSSPGSPKDPIKENNLKRVVLVKEVVKTDQPELNAEEQSKFEVIPVKKVQSRRKNK